MNGTAYPYPFILKNVIYGYPQILDLWGVFSETVRTVIAATNEALYHIIKKIKNKKKKKQNKGAYLCITVHTKQ